MICRKRFSWFVLAGTPAKSTRAPFRPPGRGKTVTLRSDRWHCPTHLTSALLVAQSGGALDTRTATQTLINASNDAHGNVSPPGGSHSGARREKLGAEGLQLA